MSLNCITMGVTESETLLIRSTIRWVSSADCGTAKVPPRDLQCVALASKLLPTVTSTNCFCNYCKAVGNEEMLLLTFVKQHLPEKGAILFRLWRCLPSDHGANTVFLTEFVAAQCAAIPGTRLKRTCWEMLFFATNILRRYHVSSVEKVCCAESC